jgi:hypothetical protein
MPVIPMQIGLVLKPGPQEPWTPYRMAAAFTAAGIPAEAISIYPGGPDVGAAVLANCERSMIFGGTATVERYKGNPNVQVHGPGFSKILLGDDKVDQWEKYLDIMVDSVFVNSGRGCINCSGVWASRHTEKIAEAIAARIAEEPAAYWHERFAAVGVPSAPCLRVDELFQDEHFLANGLWADYEHPRWGHIRQPGATVRWDAQPMRLDRRAPLLGEHTDEVLSEFGFAPHRIAALHAAGALGRGDGK